MNVIAFLIGGLVPTGLLITFVFLWTFRKLAPSPILVWLGANVVSIVVVTIIAGFGLADGGSPRFADALTSFITPQLIWLLATGLITRGRIAKAAKG